MLWKRTLFGCILTGHLVSSVQSHSSNDARHLKHVDDDHAEAEDSTQFLHFVAHNNTMTCSADEHAMPFNNQIRGVNLGGWMVLEPWITPSLFYQFLGQGEGTTAFDHYTFCEVLGPEEANRQLISHWDTWVTEDIIKQLKDSGAVNSLRLPVGDFMFVPYGPYVGCVEGALERVEKLLDWAYANGLTVLIDIHTQKGSQNGFDNSGQSMGFAWTSALSSEFAGLTTFEHWPIRKADWIGEFSFNNVNYTSINYKNIEHSLEVIRRVVDRYGQHPAVLGLEPVNEPWQYTPLDALKRFYWEGYLIVKRGAPYWKYIMHDSFRFDPNIWGGFMAGCPERALDTHIYQAWRDPDSRLGYYADACRQKKYIAAMEAAFGPVVVGEWSLATDNCAMWLNGFNDNLPGFPRLPCKYTPCAEPYMGTDQPGTPVDPSKPMQGPYGTGLSSPVFGMCPGSRDWIMEKGNPLTGMDLIKAPPAAPKGFDDTDNVMMHLALKKIDAFSGTGHGFYFWNFRTDLYEPQWSYLAAMDRGWIPKGNLAETAIQHACVNEDTGEYQCVLKNGQIDKPVRDAIAYIYWVQGLSNSTEAVEIMSKTGQDFQDAAAPVIHDFFAEHRLEGVTCDFGGIAMLLEVNRTLSNDVSVDNDDYFARYIEVGGPKKWKIAVFGVLALLMGGLIGFVSAMHFSPKFNRRVRNTVFMKPLAQSRNKLIRSSLALPALDENYEEIRSLMGKNNY